MSNEHESMSSLKYPRWQKIKKMALEMHELYYFFGRWSVCQRPSSDCASSLHLSRATL